MSNLPEWVGADSVYRRLGIITRELGRRQYAAWCQRKRPRKADRFRVSDDLVDLIDAMGRGDEETLKAAVWRHRHLL